MKRKAVAQLVSLLYLIRTLVCRNTEEGGSEGRDLFELILPLNPKVKLLPDGSFI